MELLLASYEDLDLVEALYNQVRNKNYCVWNEYYPDRSNIDEDYNNKGLYVVKEEGSIIASLSVVVETEFDEFNWKEKDNICEISRVVVSLDYQNKKIGSFMIGEIIKILKNKYKSIHLAVEINNVPAIKLYKKFDFEYIDKTYMFEHYYYLYEKEL